MSGGRKSIPLNALQPQQQPQQQALQQPQQQALQPAGPMQPAAFSGGFVSNEQRQIVMGAQQAVSTFPQPAVSGAPPPAAPQYSAGSDEAFAQPQQQPLMQQQLPYPGEPQSYDAHEQQLLMGEPVSGLSELHAAGGAAPAAAYDKQPADWLAWAWNSDTKLLVAVCTAYVAASFVPMTLACKYFDFSHIPYGIVVARAIAAAVLALVLHKLL